MKDYGKCIDCCDKENRNDFINNELGKPKLRELLRELSESESEIKGSIYYREYAKEYAKLLSGFMIVMSLKNARK